MSNVHESQDVALNARQAEVAGLTDHNFDPSRFGPEIDEFDISDNQKRELLATLWSIMRSFVETGLHAEMSSKLLCDFVTIPGDDKLD